jgi:hypothetical protein
MAAIRLARHPRWAPILAVVALLNFILYVIAASSHGGDAWNGHIKNARYFVSQHGHGTEVSRTFWVYSVITRSSSGSRTYLRSSRSASST